MKVVDDTDSKFKWNRNSLSLVPLDRRLQIKRYEHEEINVDHENYLTMLAVAKIEDGYN